MLNVCIERRLQRERSINTKTQWTHGNENHIDEAEEKNDTEEEFYDCYDDQHTVSFSPVKEPIKPEGRLKRLHNFKLLNTEEYLYVPITQEPVPKTEDQLQKDTDVMLKSTYGLVTAIMCSTLQSDMESFKAANLNACFEDFIRWYSPNDWEEYIDDANTKKYKLSDRMSAEDNTWQVMWQKAKAVPACRQKRLFDDTTEGVKVLKYLKTRNLGDIFGLTIVPLLHSTILKLKDMFENSNALDIFSDLVDEILADLNRYSRDIEIKLLPDISAESPDERNYVLQLGCPLKIINKIEKLELQFYHFKCFERSLPGTNLEQIKKKFKDVLTKNGVCVIYPKYFTKGDNMDDKTTEVDERLIAPFKRDMENRLISKEYVMRLEEGLIEPAMPQFLRAIVTNRKLRLCGAFTENTTF